ncbi:glycoside hydrolase family 2 protein [Hyaloscypha variabilis F]|uniref:Glycoside hydrolase family 2 protein n=1 Tax=Hyaloscypha variabilis (strain UAMH 11265 / GT02V1 / F) TaxID=1149755 RepID=A0A2J6RG95_HYAVF|nr:glycoside hydrolase family 2 protein [Hyaloscypha variabilis F]
MYYALRIVLSLLLLSSLQLVVGSRVSTSLSTGRQRISLNASWRFSRWTSAPDSLTYATLKPYILPSGNDFISVGSKHARPTETAPGSAVTYAQDSFDDSTWEIVTLPHDWAQEGPFNAPGISGGMGRLPSNGVGWYRRNITMDVLDTGKSVFLDIDGAMSYTAVWLNGNLVGGWPYGYASFRLDLTQYLNAGENLLAIRLDNPTDSSRWYPGAGLYRNVWLVTVDTTHVGQYGTYITTPTVSAQAATIDLTVVLENKGVASRDVEVLTEVYEIDPATEQPRADVVATFSVTAVTVAAGSVTSVNNSATMATPQLWGPPPVQTPNLYVARTTVSSNNTIIDTYDTQFGIRSVACDANKGVLVNGRAIRVQGTNNHHDQGSLGSAFHIRAAERQLEMLQEMGCNALRMSHNPPGPELLDLADRMGFMVLDEIFDCWTSSKTTNDFHQIWADWHEPDLRSFIRRDRNHPSVIAWSFGNEIVDQQQSASGGTVAQPMHDWIHAEDPTRPTTSSMNIATAGSSFANVMDIESLNYQGEGLGSDSNSSSYPSFHSKYPNKMLWSSESAAALSTRGTYIFPVASADSATVGTGSGGNATSGYVSAYELYAPSFGSSLDKVFSEQDKNSFAAGEFVWTGWDYLGEPTPYSSSRSSYFGIIDLAGFKKDRFYLYQSRWRPDFRMAHILPHWTWPERIGQVTPVHVFSAADEAELFVNGKSAGRIKKAASTYRFRWDTVSYQPGNITVVTYKNGTKWAVDTKRTVGDATKLNITADRNTITGDGYDLSFITVTVVDDNGDVVPRADNAITFSVSGPGEIVSTDNGDPTDMTAFPSTTRKAFSGLALAVVRAIPGSSGQVIVSATAAGLLAVEVELQVI